MTAVWDRALIALGGIAGLAGVALAAAAAHVMGATSAETAARFLLFHAPVLLALAALIGAGAMRPALGRSAGLILAAGLVLFCGDLALRALRGVALAPMAAPTGGVLLMLGWAAVTIAAFVPPDPSAGGRRPVRG